VSDNSDQLSVLLQEYLNESEDMVDEIEQILLAMEDHEDKEHLWGCLMRDLHSFKGSAQLMGLDPIVSLAHNMESVIIKFRQKYGQVDQSLIETCFECIDVIRELDSELSISGTCMKDTLPILTKMKEVSS